MELKTNYLSGNTVNNEKRQQQKCASQLLVFFFFFYFFLLSFPFWLPCCWFCFLFIFSLIKIYIYTNMYIYIIDYTKTNTHIRQIYNIHMYIVCLYIRHNCTHTSFLFCFFFTSFFSVYFISIQSINCLFQFTFFLIKLIDFFIYTLWLLLSNHL